MLVLEIVILKLEGLPAANPCTCGKCACSNGCHCRVTGPMCCKECKCMAIDFCQNPIKKLLYTYDYST